MERSCRRSLTGYSASTAAKHSRSRPERRRKTLRQHINYVNSTNRSKSNATRKIKTPSKTTAARNALCATREKKSLLRHGTFEVSTKVRLRSTACMAKPKPITRNRSSNATLREKAPPFPPPRPVSFHPASFPHRLVIPIRE